MGNNNIELGAGTLYFKTPEGWDPLGEIREVTESDETIFAEDTEPVIKATNALHEVTLSLQMVGDSAAKATTMLRGIVETAYRLLELNKRVAHLSRYGRTYRIRKKNCRRLQKIIMKELREDEKAHTIYDYKIPHITFLAQEAEG